MKLSILLCTRNPRPDTLATTLESLSNQHSTDAGVELVIIDNASTPPLEESLIGSFPFPARIVREPVPGLTNARLRGFDEATASLLLLVDDDNRLEPDYIANALHRFDQHPRLGCAGGSVLPQYERPAPAKWKPLLSCLALREVVATQFTDAFAGASALPYGAGMVLRAEIARHYGGLVRADPKRGTLDRRGGSLSSCGDLDLACCAYDCGYQCGLFPELKLTHLIPASRTEPRYLKSLAINIAASGYLLWKLRAHHEHPRWNLLKDSFRTLARAKNLRRRLLFLRGSWRAALLGR